MADESQILLILYKNYSRYKFRLKLNRKSRSLKINPLYYDLINEFYSLTGIPVIINTSMNVMGEPIVNTPEQAFNMIIKTDMDCIVMGNNLIFKNKNS